MAFLGPFNAAVVNPSLVLLGEAFDRPTNIVTYSTTIAIITGGLAVSLLLTLLLSLPLMPVSHSFGPR